MQFADIPGQLEQKRGLTSRAKEGRVSHAQLFAGPEGSANMPMALAFAQYLMCQNPTGDDSCGVCASCKKVDNLQHPDLHFSFPFINAADKKVKDSTAWLIEWREYLQQTAYLDAEGWLENIDAGNKPCLIPVAESESILKRLSLKSYEGGYKVLIIWMPERMNGDTANKLLKIIEEPPAKTIFLLVTHNTEGIISTILSRTQLLRFHQFDDETTSNWIRSQAGDNSQALQEGVVQLVEGNLARAYRMVRNGSGEDPYLDTFIKWMRWCYSGKVQELSSWADGMHKEGREHQKQFIEYALHIMRQCIVSNYTEGKLSRLSQGEHSFTDKFAPFIHSDNILLLVEELNSAHLDISRNCYSKIVLFDLSLNVAKLLRVQVEG